MPEKKPNVLNINGREVPVSYTKTGKLDKKSIEAINQVTTADILQYKAKTFKLNELVDPLIFSGLTVSYKYGMMDFVFDIFDVFKGPEVAATNVLKTMEQVQSLFNDLGITAAVGGPIGELMIGFSKDVAENLIREAKLTVAQETENKIKILEGRLKELEEHPEKFGAAKLIYENGKLVGKEMIDIEGKKKLIQEQINELKNDIEEQKRILERIRQRAEILKWFYAMGLAGITMLICKEVSVSEIVGTLAEVMPL